MFKELVQEKKKYNGKLEGWLALWTFGLVLSPIVWIWSFLSLSSFQNELNSVGLSETFNFYIATSRLLVVISVIAFIALAIPYFAKKKETRPFAIVVCATVVVFGGIQYGLFESALQSAGSSIDQAGSTGSTFNSLLGLIWFFYWLFSRRVKATFIK